MAFAKTAGKAIFIKLYFWISNSLGFFYLGRKLPKSGIPFYGSPGIMYFYKKVKIT